MNILINGELREIEGPKMLSELLADLALDNHALAVALNEQVIPRSQYSVTSLNAGDQLELVRAVGGG